MIELTDKKNVSRKDRGPACSPRSFSFFFLATAQLLVHFFPKVKIFHNTQMHASRAIRLPMKDLASLGAKCSKCNANFNFLARVGSRYLLCTRLYRVGLGVRHGLREMTFCKPQNSERKQARDVAQHNHSACGNKARDVAQHNHSACSNVLQGATSWPWPCLEMGPEYHPTTSNNYSTNYSIAQLSKRVGRWVL
jgi:hypothetical protein